MSNLPDELWRQISRLFEEDEFWSVLISVDFPQTSAADSSMSSKAIDRLRYERDIQRKMAAHRRSVLRIESLVWDSKRKIKELECKIGNEVEKMRAASIELSKSNLRKARKKQAIFS